MLICIGRIGLGCGDHSDFELLGSGDCALVVVQKIVDPLVHLLEGFEVDAVEQDLAAAASDLLESLRAALLDYVDDLQEFLLGQLPQPLVEPVLLGLGDLLDLGQVLALLINRGRFVVRAAVVGDKGVHGRNGGPEGLLGLGLHVRDLGIGELRLRVVVIGIGERGF